MAAEPGERPNGWRKAQVLRYLSVHGETETARLARALETSPSNVHNVLSRLRDQRRVESAGGEFVPQSGRRESTHALTDRGESYLEWWEREHGGLPDLPDRVRR